MAEVTNPEGQSPPQTPQQPARRSITRWWQRLPLSNLQILLILLLIVGGRLIIDFSQRIIDGQQKVAAQQVLEAKIADLQGEREQLEADKTYYSSPTYIETWAHGEGKMVRDGEKLVIPLYQGKPQPRNAVAVKPSTEPLPKWAIWWTLFFDSPPPVSSSSAQP